MKRKVLVVDDNMLNRELLVSILANHYEVIQAVNGKDALEILHEQSDSISAVTLDLIMPEMDGYEVLAQKRKSPDIANIPVIVTTGDNQESSELRALSLGANDFATKPYNATIIEKRVENMIQFRETAAIVNAETKDQLTGLDLRGVFFKKVSDLIGSHESGEFVFSFINIDNFKVINDQYGEKKGDDILKQFSAIIHQLTDKENCLCCRVESDNFALLFPKKILNEDSFEKIRESSFILDGSIPPIRYYVGRYIVDDISLPPSAMLDRAHLAADSIKGSFNITIAYYEESMRKKLLLEQEIINDMQSAIEYEQFEVWFQPQYNHSNGRLYGAEALVRWRHPSKGLISPGDFIPIFEKNGFIYELDKYVWRITCRYLKEWIDKGLNPSPVSVNISRFDVYQNDLLEVIDSYIEQYNIPVDLLRLEITESAFVISSERIIEVVKSFVNKGFVVEIDDFGSGYSSLNTLKDVPAQIVKLDMKFLQGKQNSERGGSIIESIVRMTRWLGSSVIAEGVEEKDQADFLLSIGCYIIQGYFYSKPIPAADFEKLIIESKHDDSKLKIQEIENFDEESFWNASSMNSIIFNSFVGGACILEYCNNKCDILRVNNKFDEELGCLNLREQNFYEKFWDCNLDNESKIKIASAIVLSKTQNKTISVVVKIINLPPEQKSAYLRWSLRVIAVAGDKMLVYVINTNITAQVIAENNEHKNKQMLNLVVDRMYGGFTVVTMIEGKCKLLIANDFFYTLLGYTKQQFNDEIQDFINLVYHDDRDIIKNKLQTLIETEIPTVDDYRLNKRDGSIIYAKINTAVTKINEYSEPVIIIVLNDVTQEKLSEKKINALNNELNTIVSDIPGGYARMKLTSDGDCDITFVNKGICHILNMTADEIIKSYSKQITTGIHPDEKEKLSKFLKEDIPIGSTSSGIFRLRTKEDKYVFTKVYSRVSEGLDGQKYLNAYFYNLNDIEEKKVAYNNIMEGIMEAIMSSSKSIVYVKDVTSKYLFCSKNCAIYCGKNTPEEMIGKSDYEIFTEEVAEQFINDDKRVISSEQTLEFIITHKYIDGTNHTVKTTKIPIKNQDNEVIAVYGYSEDITIVNEAYSRLQILTNSVPGGIATFIIRNDSVVLSFYNDVFAKIFEVSGNETIVINNNKKIDRIFTEDYCHIEALLQSVRENDNPVNIVFRVYNSNKQSYKWVKFCGIVYERRDSEILLNAILIDITEEKNIELQSDRYQAQMKILTRLVDDSASGVCVIGYDNNNLLYANTRCCDWFGLTKDNNNNYISKQNLKVLLDKDTSKHYGYDNYTKDILCMPNEERKFSVNGKWINWNGQKAIVKYITDDTKRLQKQLALESNQTGLKLICNNLHCSFWKYDIDQKRVLRDNLIYQYNNTFNNAVIPDEFIKLKLVHKDDVNELLRIHKDLETNVDHTECTIRLRNRAEDSFDWIHIIYVRIYSDQIEGRIAVGFSNNVNSQLKDKELYKQMRTQRDLLTNKLLICYELNLTKRCYVNVDAKTKNYFNITPGTFFNDDVKKQILSTIHPDDKEIVENNLLCNSLLQHYLNGDYSKEIIYRRKIYNKYIYVCTKFFVNKNPETDDIIAFVYIENVDFEETKKRVLLKTIEENTEAIYTAEVATHDAILYKNNSDVTEFPINKVFNYDNMISYLIKNVVIQEDQQMCKDFFDIQSLVDNLEKKSLIEITFGILLQNNKILHKRITAFYLDDSKEKIVINRFDSTNVYLKNKEQNTILNNLLEDVANANKMKNEFFSHLSHDIRTPIKAIISLSEFAKEQKPHQNIDGYLDNINASAKFLLSLFNDVLDMNMLEKGKIILKQQVYSTTSFISELRMFVDPLMNERNIKFTVNLCDEPKYFVTDKIRFNQIFFNLLSNASKFTQRRGHVEFTSEKIKSKDGKKGVRYSVTDNGRGIEDSFLKVIFEPFTQEKIDTISELQGSGLGLSITKNLVEMMGGTIEVKSKKGKGTTFSVNMYFSEPDGHQKDEKEKRNDYNELKEKRILLVDDNDINISIEKYLLETEGCIVDVAMDGKEAVDKVSDSVENYYDFILMDIKMPVMDGIKAVEKIRKLKRDDVKKVTIIMMSADLKEDRDSILPEIINGFVVKPIDQSNLFETMVNLLEEQKNAIS